MPRTDNRSNRRIVLGMAWPARLDQELRKRYGDALQPKTRFEVERNAYVTSFDADTLADGEAAEVEAYIAGFQACAEMVTE